MNRIYQPPTLTTLFLGTMIAAAACQSGAGTKPAAATPSDTIPVPDRPYMWVPDTISQKEEAHFAMYNTLLAGQTVQPLADSVYYTASEFNQMVNYFASTGVTEVLIHLAVVDPNDSIGQSNLTLANKMIYIFESLNGAGAGDFILPGNADTFIVSKCQIGSLHAQDCEMYYLKTVVEQTNSLLDPDDTVNYPGGIKNAKKFSNTQFITYDLTEFQQLVAEISYQASANQDTISGFMHFFAAMPATPSKGQKGIYGNRLVSQLEFAQNDKEGHPRIFYIDTTNGFKGRNVRKALFPGQTRWPATAFPRLDNGPLCPPSCP